MSIYVYKQYDSPLLKLLDGKISFAENYGVHTLNPKNYGTA
jgi:hypothetical protein